MKKQPKIQTVKVTVIKEQPKARTIIVHVRKTL